MSVSLIGRSTKRETDGSAPAAIQPHASTVDGDLLVFHHFSNATGNNETISVPGFTQIATRRSITHGFHWIGYRIRQPGDGDPQATLTNHGTGTSGESVVEHVDTWRGVDPGVPITWAGAWAASLSWSSLNVPNTDSIVVPHGGALVLFGGLRNDVSAQTLLSGDGLTWSLGATFTTTLGLDASDLSQIGLNGSGSPVTPSTKAWGVTGGGVGGAATMFAINPALADEGTSSFTVDASTAVAAVGDTGVSTISFSDHIILAGSPVDSGESTIAFTDSSVVESIADTGQSEVSFSDSIVGETLRATGSSTFVLTDHRVKEAIGELGTDAFTITARERTPRPALELVSGPTEVAISDESGFRTTEFVWESAVAFAEYAVMLVPSEEARFDEGVAIGDAFGSVNVSDSGGFPPGQITSTIDGRDLKAAAVHDGLKVIKAFARSTLDEWSQ